MLVLTRRSGQDIVIGERIIVRVLTTRKAKVKIGVDAPKDVDIIRAELALREHEAVGRGAR
jgi:carbon storage regulator